MGVVVLALLLGGPPSDAGETARSPAVVELFTSEGCSSCPPAEAVLTALAGREDVLTLGLHVTYWDGLGWRDRFGLAAAVIRQRNYVTSLGPAGAYTPQAVVNGRVDVLGSDRPTLERMIRELPPPAAIGVSRNSRMTELALPSMPAGECPCELWLLGVRPEAETAVGGGENRGRTLRATSIVRSISRAGSWMGGAEQRDVAIPTLAADVGSLIILAQRSRDGAVTAAGRMTIATHQPAGR